MDNFDFADEIWNHAGSLAVYKKDSKFFWCFDDCVYGDVHFEEIPEYLYQALKKYKESLK